MKWSVKCARADGVIVEARTMMDEASAWTFAHRYLSGFDDRSITCTIKPRGQAEPVKTASAAADLEIRGKYDDWTD